MELKQRLDEEQARPLRRVRRKRHVEECPRPSREAEGGDEMEQFGHVVDDHVGKGFGDFYAECFWGKDSGLLKWSFPYRKVIVVGNPCSKILSLMWLPSLNEGQWECRSGT